MGEERDSKKLAEELKEQEQRLEGKALSVGQKIIYSAATARGNDHRINR